MTLLPLTAEALLAYVRSPAYAALGTIPISPRRAQAQAGNPRARPDDPLLFIAIDDDGQLLGYLGTLPGDVAEQHLAWLSCIWTSPAARGRGVAKALVRAAYEAYEGRLLLTEFTGPARQLYDRLELFRPLRVQSGIRLYLRSCLGDILPPRYPLLARLRPALRLADRLFNGLWDRRGPTPATPPAGWVTLDRIPPELAGWIARRQEEELFPRSVAELHWILDEPWVFTGVDPERIADRYHFTARAERFATRLYTLRNEAGEWRAAVCLRYKDREAKLIAAYFDPDAQKATARLLLHECRRQRISLLTVYDQRLWPELAKAGTALYRRQRMRTYYQSDRLVSVLGSPAPGRIQDGDGDVFGV